MQLVTGLLAATAAALAATAAVASRLDAELDALHAPPGVPRAAPGARPRGGGDDSDHAHAGNPGGKPSAAQHRADKSRRMDERRRRVRETLAQAPHDPSTRLQRMDADALERALAASEARAREREGGDGGTAAAQVRGLAEGLARERQRGSVRRPAEEHGRPAGAGARGERALWGNSGGGGGDPYEAAGGLASETAYYGEGRPVARTRHPPLPVWACHTLNTAIRFSPDGRQTSGSRRTGSWAGSSTATTGGAMAPTTAATSRAGTTGPAPAG